MEPEFLTLADVLLLHGEQIDGYGGERGARDTGLLESAVAQPRAMYGGEFLHPTLFDQAAAYLFHIVQNHPFIDGNKRTGLMAALVFLDLNGMEIDAPKGSLFDLTIAVATGRVGKPQIAEFFRSHAQA